MKCKRLLFALLLLVTAGSMNVMYAAKMLHGGNTKEFQWAIFDDGELVISMHGNYNIPDYGYGKSDGLPPAPWKQYYEEISYITIDQTLGSVNRYGKNCFAELTVDSVRLRNGDGYAPWLPKVYTIGSGAFRGFDVPYLRIELNQYGTDEQREIGSHTLQNCSPLVHIKNAKTLNEYSVSGGHYMVRLDWNVELIRAGALRSPLLWHSDGVPSVIFDGGTPPEWQRLVDQGRSNAGQWAMFTIFSVSTLGLTNLIMWNHNFDWADYIINDREFEYPFGDPQSSDQEILCVVPPSAVETYKTFYQKNHPEVGNDGYICAYYKGEHSKTGSTAPCGRVVGGRAIEGTDHTDLGKEMYGWWYVDGKKLHIGWNGNDMLTYANGKAPWADYLDGIEELYIHDTRNIPAKAFMNGANLGNIEYVFFDEKLNTIGDNAFAGCSKIKLFGTRNGEERYVDAGKHAFYKCSALESTSTLTFRNIGDSCFYNCAELSRVSLGRNIVGDKASYGGGGKVPAGAFYGCAKLYNIDLQYIKSIGDKAFYGTAIKEVNLMVDCEIGKNAFYNCKDLKAIKFNNRRHTLESYAFANCTALQDIFVGTYSKVTRSAEIDANTFHGVTISDITLHVDPEYYGLYENTAVWKDMKVDKQFNWPVRGSFNQSCMYWELNSNGTLTIEPQGYNGMYSLYQQSYYIPDYNSVNDAPWYQYREYIKAVMIKSAVDYQGNTYGVKKIGKNAFAFPKEGESQITDIHIPRACKEIHEAAFRNNDKLVSVYIDDVEEIGSFAFDNCKMLSRIDIGPSFKKGGDYIFRNCPKLNKLNVDAIQPAEVTQYTFAQIGNEGSSSNGRRRSPAAVAAKDGQQNVTLDVPAGALNNYLVDEYWNKFDFALYDNTHGKMKSSGKFADGVWILYEDSTMVISANRDFENGDKYPFTADALKATKAVLIQGEIPSIGRNTQLSYMLFSSAVNLRYVSLPSSVKYIGSDAFHGCSKLSDMNVAQLDTIGSHAFKDCGFTSIALANTKYVGRGAFRGCKQLTEVIVDNTTEFKGEVFSGCTALKDLYLGSVVLGSNMFMECNSLEHVTYEGVELPVGAFSDCKNLKTINLGSNLQKIGRYALGGCTKLDTIFIYSPDAPEMELWEYTMDHQSVDDDINSFIHTEATPFGSITTDTRTGAYRYGSEIDHSKIHLVVPSAFSPKYRVADFWKDMIISYPEDDRLEFPLTIEIDKYSTGTLDDKGNLKIEVRGGYMERLAQSSVLGAYASLISESIEFGYSTQWTKDAYVQENGLFSWMTAEKLAKYKISAPKTITFGTMMQVIGRWTFYNDAFGPSTVFNCYAKTPPQIWDNAFNWEVLNANGAKPKLHVVNDEKIVAAYKADKTWNAHFDIVGDLSKQEAPAQYTVTFTDAITGEVVEEKKVDLGVSLTRDEMPDCEDHVGYVFYGWNSDAYAAVFSDRTVESDHGYKTHPVYFCKGDSKNPGIYNRQEVEHLADAVVPGVDPTKEGYVFKGWEDKAEKVTKTMYIYALWDKFVSVSSVSIDPMMKNYCIPSSQLHQTLQLTATILPSNASKVDLEWTSDDESVASVDPATGLVTINGFGICLIHATATDGSGKAGSCKIAVNDSEETEIINAESVDAEKKEITITRRQDPAHVFLNVTPEDYNGDVMAEPALHYVQVMPFSMDEKKAPVFMVKTEMGVVNQKDFKPLTDTITFRAMQYDHMIYHAQGPQVKVIVHIIDDSIFVENSIEGVPVTYRVTDLENNICEVYGYMEQLMEPDPETGLPFVRHPAIPVTATKVTIPREVRGFHVVRTSMEAFAGCTALQEIEFDNGIQMLRAGTFNECPNLAKISLPRSFHLMDMGCCAGLSSLHNVYLRTTDEPMSISFDSERGEFRPLEPEEEPNAFNFAAEDATLHVAKGFKPMFNHKPWTDWFKTITDDLDVNFSVRFIDYDGSVIADQVVEYGDDAVEPAIPLHADRVFKAWDKGFSRITADLTVNALYTISSFTVTFKNWDGSTLSTQSLGYGEAAVAPADPVRSGYVFKGWDKSFDNVSEDMVVTAQFAKTYTVTFVDWDGALIDITEVESGMAAEAPADPLRNGYTFSGWDKDLANITADVTVTAQYDIIILTVTFIDWDDSFIDAVKVEFAGAAVAPADPKRDDYIFVGWDTDFNYVVTDLVVRAKYTSGEGIEDIEITRPAARKVMMNGVIYIVRPDGTIYTLQGVQVK